MGNTFIECTIIGCFALVEPFMPMARQSEAIREKRGTVFGCGMAVIPLGDGVIDLPAIVAAMKGV